MNSNEPNPSAPARLSPTASATRLAAIGFALAAILGLFAYAGGWLTPRALTPATMIDTFEKLDGPHPGFRRNHAKGVCVTGWFDSNGNGGALSKAGVFAPGRVPVVGRFALGGGLPDMPDSPNAVRSMALLFKLPDGEEWRMGINDIPVFPVRTPEAFRDFLIATTPDPATGKPDPAKMQALFAAHPEVTKALPLLGGRRISSGFDNDTYNSLNAFRFITAQGASVPVRWSMVSLQPFEPVSTTAPASTDKNALFDALIASIHAHPLQWKLIVTVGEPGDATNDSTIPWPPERKQIDVGTLTIDGVESEDTSPTRDLTFDPLILPAGIAASDDPLLSARSAAYAQSFIRREGEPKQPSAVSPAETKK